MLPYKKCDPTHEFVYVMGPPKKMRPDQIKVDGEIVDIERWLNVIRKDWDIALEGHTVQPSLELETQGKHLTHIKDEGGSSNALRKDVGTQTLLEPESVIATQD
jgi:hypothetical protein